MYALLEEAQQELANLQSASAPVGGIAASASRALSSLRAATGALLAAATPESAQAVAVPYLMLAGFSLGGWLTARSAGRAAEALAGGTAAREAVAEADHAFLQAKLQTARFYAECLLPQTGALAQVVSAGGTSIVQAQPELL